MARTLRLEPKRQPPKQLKALPARMKDRRLMWLAMFTKSKTDMAPVNREVPKTDIADPIPRRARRAQMTVRKKSNCVAS